ncbi:beta-ketoacyl-[acyl-carrier-protein] synthase family protein [Streptomyces sp. AK02-04a]|uniref:beta-ketoacyl-[acyl-carrier-protein] synthase family protein n=1 Tax=Streptomyces sp. AK02-04a TaxID=3028649 RepID=UPI0029B436E7|nr:beta-ketoacyl-[acyl-carrier-protein] synthase family protein [Streptomyces sp. AK02-04a]MDX3763695.1 beta-ketoacyl-[acyl-carrier-protein] synthase family protein [Streptomyces sp. AK02-04a]
MTGIGMVSSAGIGADATWKSVLAGQPTARTNPDLAGLAVDFACQVPDFDPVARLGANLARRTDRYSQLAFVAGAEALHMAGLEPEEWDGTRVGVIIGTAFGGVTTLENQVTRLVGGHVVAATTVPMIAPNMLAGQLSLHWRANGPSFAACTACASGATAIGLGTQLLRTGACDLVLAGGSDAAVTRIIAAAFARMGALSSRGQTPALASRPFDAARDGFVLSEGAAVLVLERRAQAAARRATALAQVVGYGASADAHHITEPHPQGNGLEYATKAALAQAHAAMADVDHINAHATSTPKGDLVEGGLISRLFGRRATVTSVKGVLGHTMGAAGAIEAALTVLAINEQTVPPTANLERLDPQIDADVVVGAARPQRIQLALSNSSGFGGQNAVLALAPA